MNSSPASPIPANQPSPPIVVKLRGVGNVPSFKNRKRAILDSRTGKMRTLTEPKVKRWMAEATQRIASQLSSDIRITDDATLMVALQVSLIASSLPWDDSRQWISELHLFSETVERGEEGCDIIIERID